MSLNKVTVIGRLGKDPEMKSFANGDKIANFSVATTETYKDKQSGEKKTITDWHNCSVPGKLADIAEKYLRKGNQVYLEGKLKTRKYIDSNKVEKYVTEIRVNNITLLGSNQNTATVQQPQAGQTVASSPEQSFTAEDNGADDLPF